jgi:CPA2 family monovalent cation:H+ antiporter-2
MSPKTRRRSCAHLEVAEPAAPLSKGCDQCIALGDSWVHLRACLTCGRVGCCNESKNKHATRHYHETGHAAVRSLEPGESWMFCYVDELFRHP